jgi:diguanylate cyclase
MMSAENSQLDTLTGMLTRGAFFEQFKVVIQNTIRQERSVTLAFLDIDHFKEVNDNLGHTAGDTVIREVASLVSQVCVSSAILGRYGGDELVLLFPDMEREQAFLILEKIRAAVEHKSIYGEGDEKVQVQVTLSGGIASYPIDGRNENELLRKADEAIYRAKVIGRNTIRLAYEERMVPKTTHYTITQLERLTKLAQGQGNTEAELLREALDDLLIKYGVSEIPSP